jgi:DNA-binding CsgD family transcriptional regulator
VTATLDLGRAAFARDKWARAHALLDEADRARPLAAGDLEALATSAHLLGLDDPCEQAWARAFVANEAAGELARAARCAFWLNFALLNRGEPARAAGWLGRGRRLLDADQRDCVEQGYLLLPAALQAITGGDAAAGLARFGQAAKIADRFGDRDLTALARNGQARSLVKLGEADEGMAVLDEVMVEVTAGEVSPVVAGTVYCSVIEACQEILDLARAREWTVALSGWCDRHPDAVPFRGKCLVYRCELRRWGGEWPEAAADAEDACRWLSEPAPRTPLGSAHYERAELHRLTGEVAAADDRYRQASRWGRDPQPGLALLRLAQGRTDVAADSLRRALGEQHEPPARAALLRAQVEVSLAADAPDAARAASGALAALAADLQAPALEAMAASAAGSVALAEGDPAAALGLLRRACGRWDEVGAPYEVARARELIGRSCDLLADGEGAALELRAAGEAFDRLGARPDAERVRARTDPAAAPGGLTAREGEVLALVARGRTNKDIARDLDISQKTVASHIGHILTKLGLPNRSAATAYAHEHDLT